MISNFNYVIGTGWYCGPLDKNNSERKILGDSIIRGSEFHHIWFETLMHYTKAKRIIMVDSASETKPPLCEKGKKIVELISLEINPGHATKHRGAYSGWMASVILGIEYAMMSDFDYFVYVEQDLLLKGEGIIEDCIMSMKTPYLFGSGDGTPQPLQQSFFIIRKDGYKSFLSRVHQILSDDGAVSPEWKFYFAANNPSLISPILLRHGGKIYKKIASLLVKLMGSFMRGYDILPYGFGRSRPLDFSQNKYYFQHGAVDELQKYYSSIPSFVRERIATRSIELDAYLYGKHN